MHIVTIAGSPKSLSRSSSLLSYLSQQLTVKEQHHLKHFSLDQFDAHALIQGDFGHASIKAFQDAVAWADGVVIATPIYKASISGVLKTILDVLPQNGLEHKVILPVATGGSVAHLLAIDYALKPVLGAMKAQHILSGVYAQDSQIEVHPLHVQIDAGLRQRLDSALTQFHDALRCCHSLNNQQQETQRESYALSA